MAEITNQGNVKISAGAGPGQLRLDVPDLGEVRAGSFTPGLTSTGSAPSIAYEARGGYYLRLQRLVFITGRITLSSISGGSGNLRLTGLPFAVGGDEDERGYLDVAIYNAATWPANSTQTFGLGMPGQTLAGVYGIGTGTGALNFTPANLGNTTTIRFGGFYLTDEP